MLGLLLLDPVAGPFANRKRNTYAIVPLRITVCATGHVSFLAFAPPRAHESAAFRLPYQLEPPDISLASRPSHLRQG
jgi:hypothetical protein